MTDRDRRWRLSHWRLSHVLWAAFGVAVIASGVVLLRACGLMPLAVTLPVLGWNFCPSAPLALSAETERGATLTRLAGQLELELARKNLECASVPPPPPAPLELPTEAGPPRPQQTAALKPPPPPPPPPPRPEPPSPVLKMPEKPTTDLSFLKGCWRTDPFKHRAGQPGEGISTYCFDDKGSGQLEFRRPIKPGYGCRAPARARYEGQQLRIRDSDTTCSDGSQWFADSLECRRGTGDVAQCSGSANNGLGGTDSWTVRLNRVN